MSSEETLIESFHQMWDTFPGFARLIHRNHTIIAANKAARDAGFMEEIKCINVGNKEIHKGCKFALMFKTGEAQIDNPEPGKTRGWLPVRGYPEICVHFTLSIK